jgi:hypothetical protein
MEGIAGLLGIGFLFSVAMMLVVPLMVIGFFVIVYRMGLVVRSTANLERIVRTHFEQEIR